jgi:hypothetical protein
VNDPEASDAIHRPGVLVAPASPRTFDHDDFEALVRELNKETGLMADAVQIRVGYLYGDVWPPGFTWINVILDKATTAAIGAVVAAITSWGRDWIRKARKRNPDAEPIKAIIYGPDGEILRELEVPPDDS